LAVQADVAAEIGRWERAYIMPELPEELTQLRKTRLAEEQHRRDKMEWQFRQFEGVKEGQFRKLGLVPPPPIDKLRFWSFMSLLVLMMLGLWFIHP
jgi:hypothetical protein